MAEKVSGCTAVTDAEVEDDADTALRANREARKDACEKNRRENYAGDARAGDGRAGDGPIGGDTGRRRGRGHANCPSVYCACWEEICVTLGVWKNVQDLSQDLIRMSV